MSRAISFDQTDFLGAYSLGVLGRLYKQNGHYEVARDHLEASAAIFRGRNSQASDDTFFFMRHSSYGAILGATIFYALIGLCVKQREYTSALKHCAMVPVLFLRTFVGMVFISLALSVLLWWAGFFLATLMG